jgi:anti-sigma B factor antagonist
MSFTVDIQKHKLGGYIVKLAGHLDAVTHIEFEETITPYLQERPFVVVLDMTELNYVSSAGFRVIYKTWKIVGKYDGKFLMAHINPRIKTVMDTIKSLPGEHVFSCMEQVDEYLEGKKENKTNTQH